MSKIVDVLRSVAPHGNPIYFDGFANDVLLAEYEITTPLRQAHLCAQVMGETGGLTVVQENMNYDAERLVEIFGPGHSSAAVGMAEALRIEHQPRQIAERVYGLGNPHMANMLGNIQNGDGWVFRGIGPLQSTGRGAAKRWGDAINTLNKRHVAQLIEQGEENVATPDAVDFVANVMLMVDPRYVMLPPLFEWSSGQCNALADKNDVRSIRRIINGGYNGLSDVKGWLDRLWPLFRAPEDPAAHWQAATADDSTKSTQSALNKLGYTPQLTEDGRYGPATEAAVEWFQRIAGIKVDGVAGPVTRQALQLRLTGMPRPNTGG